MRRRSMICDQTGGFMIDFWRSATRQQFHAAIDMLANAIEACPESVWSGQGQGAFWYLAFHTLFFLDLYLSGEDEPRFHPPPPFGLTELEPEVVIPDPAYRKDELLSYLEHGRKRLDAVMTGMTETWVTSPCPIPYRAMSNGELLLYNMRHVQHHAAQLNLLLRQRTNSAPLWVSKGGHKPKA
jgi:DinB superfamily